MLPFLISPFTEVEFHVETQVVQIDFGHGRPIYDKIKAAIAGKEIGILGNCPYYLKLT